MQLLCFMAIAKITEWLNSSRDFKQGVKLYEKYGSSNVLKQTFANGANSYSKNRLAEELAKLEHSSNEITTVNKLPVDVKLPSDLKQLRKDTINKYKDVNHLHERLEDAETDEERLNLSLKILDDDDAVTAGYKAIDHFAETGERITPPEERTRRGKDVKKMNDQELYMALKNIPTYLTKARNQLKKENLKPGRIEKYQQMIADYEADFKFINQKLGLK